MRSGLNSQKLYALSFSVAQMISNLAKLLNGRKPIASLHVPKAQAMQEHCLIGSKKLAGLIDAP